MPKKGTNNKKQKKVKPMTSDAICKGECQYNVSEDVIENKKVKEKDVFDKQYGTKNMKPKKKSKY